MAGSSSDERRIAAIVLLLGAALFLTAVLTWQAVIAGTYHRFAAQRAISDFAAIASDERSLPGHELSAEDVFR